MKKIAIIGGGNLGTSIADGLIASGFCEGNKMYLTKRNLDSIERFKNIGVHVTSDNSLAVKESDVVILAVKPFQIIEILKQVKGLCADKIIISVVTGITLEQLGAELPENISLFRCMPNTAIAIRESITCISSLQCSAEQKKYIIDLFNCLGSVVEIDEKLMDAATVLGACGIAFAMRYIRANIQGGIEIGFDSKTAGLIVAQTVKGASELLLQKGLHPEAEIDKVTTPKGCTIAGLNEMEHQGFSSSLIKGISSSFKKINN